MAVDALAQIILAAATELGATLSSTQAEQLGEYTELVTKWQRIVNLTAANTPTSFVRQHIVDCLSALSYVKGTRAIDVGTGAGLPGLVIAIALPQVAMKLIESHGKRARFLVQVQIELGLSNVEIIHERVEDHVPAVPYDTVIARAFGSFPRLIADTRNLQQPGTRLIAMKSTVDMEEIAGVVLASHSMQVVALDVPGISDRNLIVVDFAG